MPCHEDFRAQAPLPNGDVRLTVTVLGPNGEQASDERWIKVDASGAANLPVQVVDSVSHQPLPGLQVQASTVLYEWRARFGHAATQPDGMAQLALEQLTQFPTLYTLTIPPAVYHGELYSSDQPVIVTLTPGANSYPTVTMTAHALSGQINGGLGGGKGAPLARTTVWAIQLPAGPAYQTALEAQNSFVFKDIPISQYLVAPDAAALAEQNLYTSTSQIDLFNMPVANLSFSLEQGRPLFGQVNASDRTALPFAWINVGNADLVQPNDPASGAFLVPNLPAQAAFVTVSAPGFYAQSHSLTDTANKLDLQLAARPETQFVPWGDGQIVLPPETKATRTGLDFNLEYGWLWGQNAASSSLKIHIPGVDISTANGQFALEAPPEGTGWLYVTQGQAEVSFAGAAPVEVRSGEMIALTGQAQPFPINSAVIAALHPALQNTPISEVIEPSLGARLQNWLVKAGISTMQFITFITYILSLVALITIPLLALFSYHRKKSKHVEHQ